MSKIFKCLKSREWVYMLVAFVVLVSQAYIDLSIPEYMSEITILVKTDGSTLTEILQVGGIMLGLSIFSLLLTITAGFFSARIATTIAKRLREQVYNKTVSFSMADINKFSTGSLITRTTNDITQIQTLIAMGFIAIFRAPIMAIGAIIKISGKNLSFTTLTLIAVASLLVILVTVLILTVPRSKKIQKYTDNVNTVVREHLIGVRVVRAYNAEQYQEKKFEKNNDELTNANLFVNRGMALIHPYMSFIMSALTLGIYAIGAILINNSATGMEQLTIFSDMVVFSSYAMQIIMSFMMLTFTFISLPRVIVCVMRINEVIDYDSSIYNGTVTESNESFPISVEFKNVSFSYNESEEMVLQNVSFSIERGQTVAFIGATGSGKTTIVNLIMRFYDATSGEIFVDGINIKEYDLVSLRKKLGLVTQKAFVFSGDVASNIAYGEGENFDENKINNAVNVAQATDFVANAGIHKRVSQSGLNLSGGQKQRLSIARAIYKNPEIYIFDDCFSALDYKTDKQLRQELLAQTDNQTKLMVAQRISTVKDADQIVVLDDGQIAGIGKHRDLLDNCDIYREIAESQLSKEELAYA